MKTCELCGSERKLYHHHLTYTPEKIILLCYLCHITVHRLARLPKVTVQATFDMIETYGSHWNNGVDNFFKSQYLKEYRQSYHQNNKEHRKEYHKEWHQSNKEYQKEYHKKWHQNNKEQQEEYKKQWRKANKEKMKEYNRRAYKKRILKD